MENERWKDIQGYKGAYRISDYGQVMSYKGINKNGRVMLLNKIGRGYLQVQLKLNSQYKDFLVSRLVAQAFIPNPLNKPQVNHKDGIKTNNNYKNLEWASPEENQRHSYWVLGNRNICQKGELHIKAKLNKKEVIKIRDLYKTGNFTQKQLGYLFKITPTNISSIINNLTWKETI